MKAPREIAACGTQDVTGRILRGALRSGFPLIFGLYLLFVTGCSDKISPGAVEVKRLLVTGVTVTEAIPARVEDYYEASGTVKAKTISTVSGRVMGTVTSVKVREGDRVHAGQVLITIDDSDLVQRVNAAEAGYRETLKTLEVSKQTRTLVDTTYRRYKKLSDEKAISQQEMDQVETQKNVADIDYERALESVNRAKAGLSEARVYHGFTKIVAPFQGVVTEKKIDPGSMALPGAPLLVIEDNSSYRVETNLDESISGTLKTGMPVEVFIDSAGQKIKGTLAEIVPAIDTMSRTFLVKIDVKGPSLRTGQYARVRIPTGTKEAVLAPAKAVMEKGQLTGLYTVDGKGVISYRLVRTGKTYNDGVEILSGINPGEKFISGGAEKAVDGGIISVAVRPSPAR